MTAHQLVPLLALALNILLLGSALIGDRGHGRNRIFALIVLALSVWNFGVYGLRGSTTPESAVLWERVVHVGVIPIAVLFFHYVLAFVEVERRSWLLIAGYALAGFFTIVSPTSLFMTGVVSTYWGYAPKAGPLYAAFFLYFQFYMVVGLVSLALAYRSMRSGFRRNRLLLLILGVSVSLAGGLVDFGRYILNLDRLYPIGIPANSVFAIALGVAIVRYRLWDVSVLVRKALLYLTSVLVFAPVAAVLLYVFGDIPSMDDIVDNVWTVAGFVLAALLVVPAMRRVEQSFNHMMFARRHGVRDILLALGRDLASILDLTELGRALTRGLVERVPVMHATLYLPEGDREPTFKAHSREVSEALDGPLPDEILDPRLALWIRLRRGSLMVDHIGQQAPDPSLESVLGKVEAARVAMLVPLWLDGELAGILAVGEKVSGGIFDSAETKLLEMLAGQTAIALKNAGLYANVRRQMEELKAAQQQLVQSAKLAAIGELAASVAHELNSPLTVILGNTQILARRIKDEAVLTKLSAIEQETERAARIIRNLLDFSRKREPRRDPVSINAVVDRAVELAQHKLRGKNVHLTTALEPRVPVLPADTDQLTQVLLNFIGNAIDAMPDGGTLTVATAIGPEGEVEFSVTDTGCGMTAEQAARIFEPFFTTKGEGKGTGLGLSISLGIVRGHGGFVSVESEPGKGTTMRARLPVGPVRQAAEVSA